MESLIGSLAALWSITSFIPQIFKIIRTRDASAVSLHMYALTVTAFSLWTWYGLTIASWPVIVSNTAALVISGITLVLKWHFARKDPQGRAPPKCRGAGWR